MYSSDKGRREAFKQSASGRRLRSACATGAAAVVFTTFGMAGGVYAAEGHYDSLPDRSTVQKQHSQLDPSNGGEDQFIVKYRDNQRSVRDRNKALDQAGKAADTDAEEVRETSGGQFVVSTSEKLDKQETSEFMAALEKSDQVEYVEVDSWVTIAADERPRTRASAPNDAYYGALWGLHGRWGANVPPAWEKTKGKDVVVAVLDTGIVSHPDLDANVVSGYDFVSDASSGRDGNGRDPSPRDEGDWYGPYECTNDSSSASSSWHGSHVAGTVAAVENNRVGVVGVAPRAKVQPVRVLGKCGGRTSDIADAIVWAAGGNVPGVPANRTPAQVINMSLGGTGQCTNSYRQAINTATSRGATVVVAAGNERTDAAGVTPANCQNVVTVGASDANGLLAHYSNFGAPLDVTAPGGDTRTPDGGILSTVDTGSTTPRGSGYAKYQGTSMATPHVAGVAALMKSSNPGLTPAQIEATLRGTSMSMARLCNVQCGVGTVDAAAAVNAVAKQAPVPGPAPTPTPEPSHNRWDWMLEGRSGSSSRVSVADGSSQ